MKLLSFPLIIKLQLVAQTETSLLFLTVALKYYVMYYLVLHTLNLYFTAGVCLLAFSI